MLPGICCELCYLLFQGGKYTGMPSLLLSRHEAVPCPPVCPTFPCVHKISCLYSITTHSGTRCKSLPWARRSRICCRCHSNRPRMIQQAVAGMGMAFCTRSSNVMGYMGLVLPHPVHLTLRPQAPAACSLHLMGSSCWEHKSCPCSYLAGAQTSSAPCAHSM